MSSGMSGCNPDLFLVAILDWCQKKESKPILSKTYPDLLSDLIPNTTEYLTTAQSIMKLNRDKEAVENLTRELQIENAQLEVYLDVIEAKAEASEIVNAEYLKYVGTEESEAAELQREEEQRQILETSEAMLKNTREANLDSLRELKKAVNV